ncbi:MAG: cation:proton antiporter, partial [Burkholderiales bacterium]
SLGLEFSLPKLLQARKLVFGMGASQVIATGMIAGLGFALAGASWSAALTLGGILAMSSTAIVMRLLVERRELETPHGRQTFGVLLFQDLAVVLLLVLVPALAGPREALAGALGIAALKAAVIIFLLFFVGQRVVRGWFHFVALRRSHELFILNVLLVTLGLGYVTEAAGLSLALGAFVAGMLISETEYRHQVEEDIKPFREVLLGLFFVTVGMQLDLHIVAGQIGLVLGLFVAQVAVKAAVVAGLSRLFGAAPGNAIRAGLALAQAGEFGLVLASLAGTIGVVDKALLQPVIASMLLTMFAAPFLIQWSDRIAMRLTRSEWLMQSLALHQLAVSSIATEQHVVILGYGRTGQGLARFLEGESIGYVALDLDPDRVREAAAAGERVVYGDASRREMLIAAGINRASAVVITYVDTRSALTVLHHVRALSPKIPIIVRTRDDADFDQFIAAGATEVVPETFETSVMLASHALVLIGVPVRRVLEQIRRVRESRYGLLRGFFHGESDAPDDPDEGAQPRLHSVTLGAGAYAIGRTLAEIDVAASGAVVRAVRQLGVRVTTPAPGTLLDDGDVVVLLGSADAVAAAEIRLVQGV